MCFPQNDPEETGDDPDGDFNLCFPRPGAPSRSNVCRGIARRNYRCPKSKGYSRASSIRPSLQAPAWVRSSDVPHRLVGGLRAVGQTCLLLDPAFARRGPGGRRIPSKTGSHVVAFSFFCCRAHDAQHRVVPTQPPSSPHPPPQCTHTDP